VQPAPTKFGTKVVIVTYSPNRSCVPNLKLLASTVAERSRGSIYNLGCGNMIQKLLLRPKMAWVWAREHPTNFRVLPIAHAYANFSPESCFWHAIRQTRVVYLI